jgi:hypothetical protein
MIGFIVTQEQAEAINAAIAAAQTSRGLSVYWLPGAFPIFRGNHAGKCFVPGDDNLFDTPLRGNPPLTPQDFPEFSTIIEAMGGLHARIDIPANDITSP